MLMPVEEVLKEAFGTNEVWRPFGEGGSTRIGSQLLTFADDKQRICQATAN